MRFRFDLAKTTHAVAYLLHLRGGEESYQKLNQFLYMSDRRALVGHGTPITGALPVSMFEGPVLNEVLFLMTSDAPLTGSRKIWDEYVVRSGETIRLARKLDLEEDVDELSRFECRTMEEVVKEFESAPLSQLRSLPEWKNPHAGGRDPQGGGIQPISFEEILLSEGWTEEQIQTFSEEAEFRWRFTELLSGEGRE